MKKIVIASGKGGVGKSMLASSLAIIFAKEKKRIVAIDCDVDAPNLAVWLNEIGGWEEVKKIRTRSLRSQNLDSLRNKIYILENSKLEGRAEECAKKCRFGALSVEKAVKGELRQEGKKLKLNPFLCEGCGACEVFCPAGAIKMEPVKNGEIRTKKTKYGFFLVSGQLYPGETGSGKIVTEIKRRGEEFDGDIMLIDSAPGTSCPVIASLQGADFALLVTEPTFSGFSDLKRVLEVVKYFKIPWGVVINKYDINFELSDKIEKWALQKKSGQVKGRFLGRISYDKNVFKSISNLTPIMETNLKAKNEIKNIFKKLIKFLIIES